MNKNNFKLPAFVGCGTHWRHRLTALYCRLAAHNLCLQQSCTIKKGYCICVSNCTCLVRSLLYSKKILFGLFNRTLLLLFHCFNEWRFVAVKFNQLCVPATLTKTSCQSSAFKMWRRAVVSSKRNFHSFNMYCPSFVSLPRLFSFYTYDNA